MLGKYQVIVFKDNRGLRKSFSIRGLSLVILFLLFVGLAGGNAWLWQFYKSHEESTRRLDVATADLAKRSSELDAIQKSIEAVEADLQRVQFFGSKLRLMVLVDKPSQVTDSNNQPRQTSLGGSQAENYARSANFATERQGILAQRMLSHLEDISTKVRMEEVSQQELFASIYNRRTILSSTPSIWPLQNGYISSQYGGRSSPFTDRRESHKGLDIAAPIGTPVYAPANGVVSFAGVQNAYGNSVVVQHGNGLSTRYAHLHSFKVEKGQKVSRGEVIAFVGNTGRSTGPHLHYEVHVNGEYVNPLNYILD